MGFPESPTYEDLAPLDWPQLKCLLWEEIDADKSIEPQWQTVAARVNSKCFSSAPQSAQAYEAAFATLARTMPKFFTDARYPGAGQRAWIELLYSNAQRTFGRPRFMNLGFAGLSNWKLPIGLSEKDEPYRFAIQLYHQLLAHIDVRGRRVLEVGCGAGGGLTYIAEHFHPSLAVGLDIVSENLATFGADDEAASVVLVGNAEQLPFNDGEFDVVVSVESSEHYRRIEQFLGEARRVLKPRGHLLLADLRWNGRFDGDWGASRSAKMFQHQLQAAGFHILRTDDITSNVVRSIVLQDEAKRTWLASSRLSGNDLNHFFEIMLCIGSRNHDRMRRGEILYFSAVCEAAGRSGAS